MVDMSKMTPCERFELALAAEAPAPIGDAAIRHLLDCSRCGQLWLAARIVGESRPARGARRGAACPDPERLVELIDGEPSAQRDGMVRHLEGCDSCLARALGRVAQTELPPTTGLATPPEALERRALELAGSPGAGPRRARRSGRQRWLAGLVAAAGIGCLGVGLGLLLPEPGFRPASGSPDGPLRGTPDDAPRPLAPTGVVTDTAGLEFSWTDPRPQPDGPLSGRLYHLIVVDLDDGSTRIDLHTSALRHLLTPQQSARLAPGGRYRWLVEPVGEGAGTPAASVDFRVAAR